MASKSQHAILFHEKHHVDRHSKRDLSAYMVQSMISGHLLDKLLQCLSFDKVLAVYLLLDIQLASKFQRAILSRLSYRIDHGSMH